MFLNGCPALRSVAVKTSTLTPSCRLNNLIIASDQRNLRNKLLRNSWTNSAMRTRQSHPHSRHDCCLGSGESGHDMHVRKLHYMLMSPHQLGTSVTGCTQNGNFPLASNSHPHWSSKTGHRHSCYRDDEDAC